MLIVNRKKIPWGNLSLKQKINNTLFNRGAPNWERMVIPALELAVRMKEIHEQLKGDKIMFVRFEDIIGPGAGGSSREVQTKTLGRIYQYFKPQATHAETQDKVQNILKNISDDLAQNNYTYTPLKQKVGQWKSFLEEDQIELVKGKLNKYIIGLGYEETIDWNL